MSKNGKKCVLFFLRMMLVYLNPIHPLKRIHSSMFFYWSLKKAFFFRWNSILIIQKKNGKESMSIADGTVENVFYENKERFWSGKKVFHNQMERQRMHSYFHKTYSYDIGMHSINYRMRSSWERKFLHFDGRFLFVFFNEHFSLGTHSKRQKKLKLIDLPKIATLVYVPASTHAESSVWHRDWTEIVHSEGNSSIDLLYIKRKVIKFSTK
jgi:hypothetical protein